MVRSPVVAVGDLGLWVLLVEFVNCSSYRVFASCHSGGDVVPGWGWLAFCMLRHALVPFLIRLMDQSPANVV